GDLAAALSDFNEAIRLDPENSWYSSNRHYLYVDAGNYEALLADYNEAIRLYAGDATIYFERGVNYKNMADAQRERGAYSISIDNYAKAITDYNEAIRLYPGDATV